jgi:hypothetical protein
MERIGPVFFRINHVLLPKIRGISTARAKGAIGRLDFNLTPVLSARGEPECAAGGLNNRAAGTFVWIIHKLVEPNL